MGAFFVKCATKFHYTQEKAYLKAYHSDAEFGLNSNLFLLVNLVDNFDFEGK